MRRPFKRGPRARPGESPRPRAGQGVATEAPSPPGIDEILAKLGIGQADLPTQKDAVAEAAYGGRLALRELQALRLAGFLPHDKDA